MLPAFLTRPTRVRSHQNTGRDRLAGHIRRTRSV